MNENDRRSYWKGCGRWRRMGLAKRLGTSKQQLRVEFRRQNRRRKMVTWMPALQRCGCCRDCVAVVDSQRIAEDRRLSGWLAAAQAVALHACRAEEEADALLSVA